MADPCFRADSCPVCRASRAAADRCEACGISFYDSRVAELGRTLQRADRIRQDLIARPSGDIRVTPSAPGPSGAPVKPERPRHGAGAPGRGRDLPVGWILLGVGALCLIAAAGIFVAVSWDALGWFARAAVLLAATGVFAGAGELTRRRGLRASAEALSVVAGVLWLVTLVAGVRLLTTTEWAPVWVGAGTALAGLIADRWLAHHRDRLWAVDGLTALGVLVWAGGVLDVADPYGLLAALGLGAVAIAVHRLVPPSLPRAASPSRRLGITRGMIITIGVLATLVLALIALATLIDRGDLTESGKVLAVAGEAGVLAMVSRVPRVRQIATGVASGLVAAAVMAVIWETTKMRQWPVAATVWLFVAVALPGLAGWLSTRNAPAPIPPGRHRAGILSSLAVGWLIPPAVAGVLVIAAAFGAVLTVPSEPTENWWLTASAGFVALGLIGAVHRSRTTSRPLHGLDAAVVQLVWTAGLVVLLGHDPTTLAVLGLALMAGLVAGRLTHRAVPLGCAAWPAVLLGLLALHGGETAPIAYVIIAGAAAGLLAMSGWGLRPGRERLIAEAAALAWGAVVGLLAWLLSDRVTLGTCLLLIGLGLVTAGLAPGQAWRRACRWLGIGVLTLASWAFLDHLGVRLLEAYTLPAAALLLALGVRRLRHDRHLIGAGPCVRGVGGWRTLGPGLALGLLPSALLAYAEPVSVRAVLVGAVAVGLILLGVFGRLAAPLVTGALVLSVLAVTELWPYAAVVPRWLLLASAGIVLVIVGVRWEARLQDLRRVGGYLRDLR